MEKELNRGYELCPLDNPCYDLNSRRPFWSCFYGRSPLSILFHTACMLVFVIRSSLTINPNYCGIGNKFINPFYALWGLWLKLPKALTFHKVRWVGQFLMFL